MEREILIRQAALKLITDRVLSERAGLLLSAIANSSTPSEPCRRRNEDLAREIGCVEKTVRNQLDELEEKGFITRSGVGEGSNPCVKPFGC